MVPTDGQTTGVRIEVGTRCQSPRCLKQASTPAKRGRSSALDSCAICPSLTSKLWERPNMYACRGHLQLIGTCTCCMDGQWHGDEETHLSSLSYMAQTRSRNSTSVSGVPMLISAVVGVDDRFRGAGVGATRVCAAIGSCIRARICHAR
jgi:hypothetical protein